MFSKLQKLRAALCCLEVNASVQIFRCNQGSNFYAMVPCSMLLALRGH